MDTYESVKEGIIKILNEVTESSDYTTSLPDETSLIDNVGLDSIQMINFILLLEDEFSVEIDFENFQIDNLSSIRTLIDYLQTLKKAS